MDITDRHSAYITTLRDLDFLWQEKSIWCGLFHSAGIVAKVADFATDEQGLGGVL